MATIRAYTDPSNVRSQRVLLHCGLKQVGETELIKPARSGARRASVQDLAAGSDQGGGVRFNRVPTVENQIKGRFWKVTEEGVSKRRRSFERQLSELYGPLLSLRKRVTARYEFHNKISSAILKAADKRKPGTPKNWS